MPEVFRFYGFSFFFYSKEHEPLHIHVEGKDGCAKFDLVDDDFVMVEKMNIKANDLEKNNVSHRGRAIEKMLKEFYKFLFHLIYPFR